VPSERPPLSPQLEAAEFRRWYWLKQELTDFAKQQGLRTSGSKPDVANRIALLLNGIVPKSTPETTQTPQRPVSRRLVEPLTSETVLGPRQASSQQLRAYFTKAIGPRFSYDIHMRTFLASDRPKTLGEAVEHWHSTRTATKPETLPQLELLRFTKAWHRSNPTGTQSACRAAWQRYKDLPIDEREPLNED
jgi:hypothetical protein